MKKLFSLALVVCLVVALFSGCAAPQGGKYVLATGGTSGTYYPFGGAISQVINAHAENTNITATSTGASIENIRLISSGEADLAIVQNDVLDYAVNGTELFAEKTTGIAAVASLYPEIVQLVVGKDSGINSIADLKGKKVSVGDVGSGVEANAKQILELYGMTFDDIKAQHLSFKESASTFQDGQIDAFFVTAGIPNTAIVELSLTSPVKLLGFEDDKLAEIITKYPFYTVFEIPADVYKTDAPTKTIAIKATLIVSDKLSEDVVYGMTKALFENLGELGESHAKGKEVSLEAALDGISTTIHPGALKYFKEKGIA